VDSARSVATRRSGNNVAYARKPGVSLEQANADAKRVAAVIATIDPVRLRNSPGCGSAEDDLQIGIEYRW